MGHNDSHRGARIARNTLMLYVRMLVLMLVGLYTSRVVLEALGETDFGIYNVVGGVVAMFTIISGALNSAVQRFITFEMGKTEGADLNKVYSTAVNIQLILAAIIVILAEPIGIWFINNEMTISPDRIKAAEWVLHFSLLAFVINLMSVPQMASITAHEKMSAYAWIGILDGLLRLGTALLIMHSGGERLIQYSVLMAVTVIIVRAAYGIYCRRHFEECRYKPVFDRILIKEMFSFAGWNFVGVTSGVLRDQGGNILVNLFSGPAVNAARGMAVQLNGAVQGFVTNFMTAVNPQITKSYTDICRKFNEAGIRTSIFVDPVVEMVEGAKACGAQRVELYTEAYAAGYVADREAAIAPYVEAAEAARRVGLGLNAGHDLSLENLEYFASRIPWCDEVSIGHALIADALYFGLENTVQLYRRCLKAAEK